MNKLSAFPRNYGFPASIYYIYIKPQVRVPAYLPESGEKSEEISSNSDFFLFFFLSTFDLFQLVHGLFGSTMHLKLIRCNSTKSKI